MHQYNYSAHEHHMRKLAEFEDAKNFASIEAARQALSEVRDERDRVCTGHLRDNPTCPCLIFSEVELALLHASVGDPDPWAPVRRKRERKLAYGALLMGRQLSTDFSGPQGSKRAEMAGRCIGTAYLYFLDE